MFGIDDALLMAALGAGGGALFNKKDPLKGALIGGALGGGASALPGLLGSATAPTASSGLLGATGENSLGYLAPEMTGTAAEQAAAPVVNMSTPAGMFDKMNYQSGGLLGNAMDTAGKYAKPMSAAINVSQQLTPPTQPIHAPQIMQPTSSPTLSQLVQQNGQNDQMQQQQEMQRRMAMRQRIRNMGGMA